MKILLLGVNAMRLHPFLQEQNEKVIQSDRPLDEIQCELDPQDFVISYGYRHIIRQNHLDFFQRCPINLHISLLPFNRGADPNLWSFLEDTPKGVSIHQIDTGLDTGDIILQEEIIFSGNETLSSSYETLSLTIEALFKNNWLYLRNGNWKSRTQPSGGTYHRAKDKEPFLSLLIDGWQTPVSLLVGKANSNANSSRQI
jgi:methionyl-tRNA formyltransferase